MMNPNRKTLLLVILAFVAGLWAMHLFKTYTLEKRNPSVENTTSTSQPDHNPSSSTTTSDGTIEQLTEESRVIAYIKENHRLPDYYITKKEAKKQGWIPSQGNLCEALPGKAIGGDFFSNRERQLPQGVQYFEADVNFVCGRRNTDRLIYTQQGRVWITHNHYKSFEEK